MLDSSITQYDPWATEDDPVISLKIPSNILRDLVLRANENGQSIEVEFAIRLARTLERDLEMIEEDNVFAFQGCTQCILKPDLMDGINEPFGSEEE